MMEITVIGAERVTAKFAGLAGNIRASVRNAILALTIGLSASVQDDYLNGQVLHVRSGRLRRSINPQVDEVGVDIVGTVATNVEYAAFWEYGFTGVETVRAHTRNITEAFGKEITPRVVSVRDFTRQINQGPRSYMRPALAAYAPTIKAELALAVAEGARK